MTATARAGHTRISAMALTSLIRIETARIFETTLRQIKVDLADDRGLLSISLTMPMTLRTAEQSFAERIEAQRADLSEAIHQGTGLVVGRVDVRITKLEVG